MTDENAVNAETRDECKGIDIINGESRDSITDREEKKTQCAGLLIFK